MSGLFGILCVDKPADFTSFDVIAKMRGIAKTKKLGHAGTLDPMATGVLPLFFGRAAKAVDLLPNHDKTYAASLLLGVTTDTQDITGSILSKTSHCVTTEEFRGALSRFTGEISQLPPMYSAKKVNGRRLYDMARQGVELERNPQSVRVYSAELLKADESAGIYEIQIECSRGTYVRTLCHDLGQALGCGAVMMSLRRTKACGFSLSDCVTLDEAQKLADDGVLAERLLPVSTVFSSLPELVLNDTQAFRFTNGLELVLKQFKNLPEYGSELRVSDQSGRFLGLASADVPNDKLKIIKLFALGESK